MYKISPDMKKEILLCLFFVSELSLVTAILANFNSQLFTTNAQRLQSSTVNQKIESWKNFVGRKTQELETVNIYYSTPSNSDKEYFGTKTSLYSKHFPAVESDSAYQMMQKEKERSYNLNLPTVSENIINEPSAKKEFYLDYYYPMHNHRTHFSGFGRSLYHSKFHRPPVIYPKTLSIRNFEKRFMDKRRYPKFLLEKQDQELNDAVLPLYSVENGYFSKDTPFISLSKISNVNKKLPIASAISPVTANETNENSVIKTYEESNTERELLKKMRLDFPNINETALKLNKVAARSENSTNNKHKQETTNFNDFDDDKEINSNLHSDGLDISKTSENGEKDVSPFHIVQFRFGRNSAMDDKKRKYLNKKMYNRVYFEKIPQNLNLSWFVYVNCSRDRCLPSNSTDEIELLNEGWILHNCTHYDCTEMYPQTESIQKFIGLILLVFSLCVLKIIVFLLLFYYCRQIKLSGNGSNNQDHWDEEKSSPFIDGEKSLKKKYGNDRNQTPSTEEFESISPKETVNNSNTVPVKNQILSSVKEEETEKSDSKKFIPRDETAVPCLISCAPNRNSLNLCRDFEKKVDGFEILAFQKCKKKDRSNIPRLEMWTKSNNGRIQKLGAIKKEQNIERKTLQNVRLPPRADRDIMLMNLDDEGNNSSCTSEQTERITNWSTVLENECKSFISIDLRDVKEKQNDSSAT